MIFKYLVSVLISLNLHLTAAFVRHLDFGEQYESALIFGDLNIRAKYGVGVAVNGPSRALIEKIHFFLDTTANVLNVRASHELTAADIAKITVTINFNQTIHWPKITVNDGSTVHVSDCRALNELELVANNSKIIAKSDKGTHDVISRIYGSGIITLSGECVRSFVGVWGTGSVNAVNMLATERTEIVVFGSAVLTVCTPYIAGFVGGSALILYTDPTGTFNSTNVSTSGSVHLAHI